MTVITFTLSTAVSRFVVTEMTDTALYTSRARAFLEGNSEYTVDISSSLTHRFAGHMLDRAQTDKSLFLTSVEAAMTCQVQIEWYCVTDIIGITYRSSAVYAC